MSNKIGEKHGVAGASAEKVGKAAQGAAAGQPGKARGAQAGASGQAGVARGAKAGASGEAGIAGGAKAGADGKTGKAGRAAKKAWGGEDASGTFNNVPLSQIQGAGKPANTVVPPKNEAARKSGAAKKAWSGEDTEGTLKNVPLSQIGLGAAPTAQPAKALGDIVTKSAEALREGVETVRDGVTELGEIFKRGVEEARKQLPSIIESPLDIYQRYKDAFDVEKNVKELKPGDNYKIEIGGSATIDGVKGGLNESAQVECKKVTDPKTGKEKTVYVLSYEGQLLGGVSANNKSLTLGAGAKSEMTFDSPEEAARAVRIIQAMHAEPHNPTPGVDVEFVPAKDKEFLAQHTTAIEFKGEVAAAAAKSLGLEDKTAVLNTGFGSVGGKGEVALRIEMKDGKPTEVAVRTTVTGEVEGSSGIQVGKRNAGDKNDTVSTPKSGGSVKLEASASLEVRCKVPQDVSMDDLMRDPQGTVERVSKEMHDTRSAKLTVTVREDHGKGGIQGEISLEGNLEDVARPDIITAATHGDMSMQGVKVKDGKVSVAVDIFEKKGIAHEGELEIAGEGVGGKVVAQRTSTTPIYRYPPPDAPAADQPSSALPPAPRTRPALDAKPKGLIMG